MAKSTFTTGYTARDVARLLGLSLAQLRAWVRAGFLDPRRGPRREYRFTFQDLVLLRTAKALAGVVPPRKLRRALRRLRTQLPSGRPLTGVQITTDGRDVVVRDGAALWKPDSGQGVLDFEVAELAEKVAPLARRAALAARAAEPEPDAAAWYALACDLESSAPGEARDAYRRVLELDPDHVEARVNLGRLLHEAGHTAAAETHYRLALRARPADPTASFNLGVALDDLGRTAEAVRSYEAALAADPDYADAHFNLARLYERTGKRVAALRHFKAYRQLTRGR
jgi:tetratricopeptide (TPR) repeat protein